MDLNVLMRNMHHILDEHLPDAAFDALSSDPQILDIMLNESSCLPKHELKLWKIVRNDEGLRKVMLGRYNRKAEPQIVKEAIDLNVGSRAIGRLIFHSDTSSLDLSKAVQHFNAFQYSDKLALLFRNTFGFENSLKFALDLDDSDPTRLMWLMCSMNEPISDDQIYDLIMPLLESGQAHLVIPELAGLVSEFPAVASRMIRSVKNNDALRSLSRAIFFTSALTACSAEDLNFLRDKTSAELVNRALVRNLFFDAEAYFKARELNGEDSTLVFSEVVKFFTKEPQPWQECKGFTRVAIKRLKALNIPLDLRAELGLDEYYTNTTFYKEATALSEFEVTLVADRKQVEEDKRWAMLEQIASQSNISDLLVTSFSTKPAAFWSAVKKELKDEPKMTWVTFLSLIDNADPSMSLENFLKGICSL